ASKRAWSRSSLPDSISSHESTDPPTRRTPSGSKPSTFLSLMGSLGRTTITSSPSPGNAVSSKPSSAAIAGRSEARDMPVAASRLAGDHAEQVFPLLVDQRDRVDGDRLASPGAVQGADRRGDGGGDDAVGHKEDDVGAGPHLEGRMERGHRVGAPH